MTIDRAIEILNPEHREHYDGMDEVNEACRMGMEALKRNRWIPCSERLPELQDTRWVRTVIVCARGHVMPMIYERDIVQGKAVGLWKWMWREIFKEPEAITHWMPLPEMPEKEGTQMAGGLHYESLADLPPGMRQQVAGKVAAKAAVTVAGRRESKYHNEPVTVKGIRFDSKKEARRYLQLTDAVREGLISDLRLQQDFTLQEAYMTPEGQRIRAIRYKADFTYKIEWAGEFMPTGVPLDDLECWRRLGRGAMVVEDTKSAPTRTPQYRIKYKMMADKGYIIREV